MITSKYDPLPSDWQKPTWAWLLRHPVSFIGMGFGSGLAAVAPGTFGTLPALPLAWVWFVCGFSAIGLTLLTIYLFVAGIYICGRSEKEIGRQDYGGIVWDEIVAMLLVLAWVPLTWGWWLAAFAVFRFFDAVKPWPIRWFDKRLHGGFGIMWDDVLAAGYSMALLQFLFWLFN